ncbi:MAG: hypothetical protein HN350_22180, partial [Phycisphaerales bacterium]|nr:hypothetical protein [Phycisphaerales bacterium]
ALIAIAVISLAGCDFRTTRPTAQTLSEHLSIVTYNVNFAMNAPDQAAQTIREINADIVCLQETTDAWEQYLSGELGDKYPHRIFKTNIGGEGSGMGVMSKAPFKEISYAPPLAGYFSSLVLQAQTPIGTVQICNVHLRPSATESGGVSIGMYLTAPRVHAREVEEAYQHMDPSAAAIVLGDFNEDDFGGGIKWLVAKGYTNALPEFDTKTKTWRWKTSLLTFRDRLDHIVYSPNLRATSARVVNKGQSDHLPVVAIIERRTVSEQLSVNSEQ